jgi:hypothetical protein
MNEAEVVGTRLTFIESWYIKAGLEYSEPSKTALPEGLGGNLPGGRMSVAVLCLLVTETVPSATFTAVVACFHLISTPPSRISMLKGGKPGTSKRDQYSVLAASSPQQEQLFSLWTN